MGHSRDSFHCYKMDICVPDFVLTSKYFVNKKIPAGVNIGRIIPVDAIN